MSISYSGITNYGKATLPSVESWGTNMNILRDPPKSIMTRRIDRVGQTSSITELIDDSGNRSCEAISLYARGVNPSVSVDYGNAGNNGGQHSKGVCGGISSDIGTSGNRVHNGEAYLPYRIIRDGAFRPPIVSPFNLLPLSRMPRVNTDAFTKPGFVDFSKKLQCPGGNYREVKEITLKGCIRPTATYRLDAPITEPFEVKYMIKNPVKFDESAGNTGIRTRDITNQDVKEPTKEINTTPLYAEDVYANLSGTVKYSDNSHMDTKRYIQDSMNIPVQSKKSQAINITSLDDIFGSCDIRTKDAMNIPVQSKKSQAINITSLDDIFGSCDIRTKDAMNIPVESKRSQAVNITSLDDIFGSCDIRTKDAVNISYTPLKTGYTKDEHIHKDLELQNRVLAVTMETNKQRNIHVRPEQEYQAEQQRNRPITSAVTNMGTTQRQSGIDLNSRVYNLKPTISAGELTGRGHMPLLEINSDIKLQNSQQHTRNQKVLEMQLGRH